MPPGDRSSAPEGKIVNTHRRETAREGTSCAASWAVKPAGGRCCCATRVISRHGDSDFVQRESCCAKGAAAHFPELGRENLLLGAYARNDKEGVLKDINHVYALFPRMKERRTQKGGTLSGGEQQMLAVGRGLMSRPKLLMMDEPSLGLAPLIVKMIFEIIKQINAEGLPCCSSEQNAKAALEVADYGYVLETGRITLQGKGQDLLQDDRVRKAYLGEVQ